MPQTGACPVFPGSEEVRCISKEQLWWLCIHPPAVRWYNECAWNWLLDLQLWTGWRQKILVVHPC
jgi:hypothetical protein